MENPQSISCTPYVHIDMTHESPMAPYSIDLKVGQPLGLGMFPLDGDCSLKEKSKFK